MENNISFTHSAENTEYSGNLSYLLNFWHTTKLNKENEFIKRNGIHPSIAPIERRENIDFTTTEGNSIQTNFYTVFRIFIENIFDKEVKTMKERNTEEWRVSFKPETKGLSSKAYLAMYYARSKNLSNDIFNINSRGFSRRLSSKPQIDFSIKIRNKDQLHSKKVLDSLEEYEVSIKENIDQEISSECRNLIAKIKSNLNLNNNVPQAALKPKAVEPVISSEIRALLPFYTQLNSSINGMDPRTKFLFILNYARQIGNLAAGRIENNEENFQQFTQLTHNITTFVGTI